MTTESESPPELPARGTITSWLPEDSVGRVRLGTGEEIRFGYSACVGLRPAIGAEVWVVEVAPHPLGGLRARVLNDTGEATPDRATAALAAHAEREKLRPVVDREVEAIKAECSTTLAQRPAPWVVAAAAGGDGLVAIEALRERMPREELIAALASIPALVAGEPKTELRLFDLEWADTWAHLEVWADPAFVAIATESGNHLGLFVHPFVLEQGASAPVVFRYHEHDPIFGWVAESAAHFVRMVEAAGRGVTDLDVLRGTLHPAVGRLLEATQRAEACDDDERRDVHALFWSGARVLEVTAAERLLALYRERGWSYLQASLEAQIALAGWQDRIDAALAKLR